MRSENHGRGIKNSLLLSVYFPHPQRHYTNLFSLRTLGALNPRCFLWTLSTITPSWGFAAIRHYKVALLPVHLRMRTDSLIFILYWHERIYLTVNWANQRENEIPWSEPHNSSVAIDAILQSILRWWVHSIPIFTKGSNSGRFSVIGFYLLSDFLNTQNTIVVVKIRKLQYGRFLRPNIVRFGVFHLW